VALPLGRGRFSQKYLNKIMEVRMDGKEAVVYGPLEKAFVKTTASLAKLSIFGVVDLGYP